MSVFWTIFDNFTTIVLMFYFIITGAKKDNKIYDLTRLVNQLEQRNALSDRAQEIYRDQLCECFERENELKEELKKAIKGSLKDADE